MIWTSTTVFVGLSPEEERPTTGPRLRALIAEHGLIRGLHRRVEAWRGYPPHGPIAISKAPAGHGVDLGHEVHVHG